MAGIHGEKSQNNRDRTLDQFRDGKIEILVATDVAARGLGTYIFAAFVSPGQGGAILTSA